MSPGSLHVKSRKGIRTAPRSVAFARWCAIRPKVATHRPPGPETDDPRYLHDYRANIFAIKFHFRYQKYVRGWAIGWAVFSRSGSQSSKWQSVHSVGRVGRFRSRASIRCVIRFCTTVLLTLYPRGFVSSLVCADGAVRFWKYRNRKPGMSKTFAADGSNPAAVATLPRYENEMRRLL